MTAPFIKDVTTPTKSRGGNGRQSTLPLSSWSLLSSSSSSAQSGGEELGLVPYKYLKRFYSEDHDDMVSLSSATTTTTTALLAGTPPRKPKAHSLLDPMSPSPQQQQVLKDIELEEDIPPPTPQARLILQAELDRSLMQQQQHRGGGFMGAGGASSAHYGIWNCPSPFVEEWKWACLRAEGYNVAQATVRILHQWRLKSELFGTPDLKVTMGDVAPNLVHAGIIQLVPTRDLGGRAVVTMTFDPQIYASQEREIKKYLFYMLASALEDEETQDKGIVLLVWNLQRISCGSSSAISSSSSVTTSFSMASSNLFAAVTSPPWGGFLFDSFWNLWKSIHSSFRIARLHYVTVVSGEDGTTYTVKETGQDKAMDKSTTLIRHHTGSSQECLHALLTYGLPIASLPITPERIETNHHHKWVEWRQRTDSYHHQHHYQLILVPTRYDILLGKHSPINAGNIRFHQMILANVMEYRQSKSAEQSAIRTQIYKSLTSAPFVSPPGSGRVMVESAKFLQPLDARWGVLWEPMTEPSATTKIAQAFQFVSRQIDQQLQQQQQQGDASSTNKDREKHAAGKDYWPSDLADFVWMKKCCFTITCKEGYHICNGDSKEITSSQQEW